VPLTVLQTQMRHADVKTTLRFYAHVISQSQRDAIERIGLSIDTVRASWCKKKLSGFDFNEIGARGGSRTPTVIVRT